jgi:antitoxin (DNA-binding transcriptional repressor) of toxin-antitoxin stability system
MTATTEQVQSDLSRLLELAQRGEEVVITRQGRVVAKLTGMSTAPPPANRQAWLARLAHLRETTATGKMTPTAEELLDDLRADRV